MSHDVDAVHEVIGPMGFTDVPFEVPEGARSITVVVDGDDSALFAVGSLVLSDGVERVGYTEPLTREDAWRMLATGDQRQVVGTGAMALQYPYVASQPVLAGPALVRVLSDRPGASFRIRVVTPIGEARAFHVSLVSMSSLRVADEEPAFIDEARAILAAGGVDLIIDERIDLAPVAAYVPTFPPGPGDASAALVQRAHAALSTDAVPLILVELTDAAGFSRGVPCPPFALHTQAVFVDPTPSFLGATAEVLPRLAAHELSHALGLVHVEDTPLTGPTISDPFDDTDGFDSTLMGSMVIGGAITERILEITPDQRFAMTRSALLQ